MTDRSSHLYIIAGHDHNGAFAPLLERLSKLSHVTIIHPQPGVPFGRAIADIRPPANVIVASHGNESSSFTWGKEQLLSYQDLFSRLPRQGVGMVYVSSCYGGSAVYAAHSLPKGTLLYSAVSDSSSNYSGDNNFLAELRDMNPSRVMIAALGAVNPEKYASRNRAYGDVSDANRVLPYNIVLGGNPPTLIHPDDEINKLQRLGREGKLRHNATYKAAVLLTESVYNLSGENTTLYDNAYSWMPESVRYPSYKSDVRRVAVKLLQGTEPKGIQEIRIATALSVAWLECSGELKRLINHARVNEPPPYNPELDKLKITLAKGYHLEGGLVVPDIRPKATSHSRH